MSKEKEPDVVQAEMLMGPVCLDYAAGPPFKPQTDTTTEADNNGADTSNPAPISFDGIEVTDNGS